jgi:hypothetical protein
MPTYNLDTSWRLRRLSAGISRGASDATQRERRGCPTDGY